MNNPEPNIRIKVDVTNPGQFFACCGLLELADRLRPGAEGWFDQVSRRFCLCTSTGGLPLDAHELLKSLIDCEITNTMTTAQVRRRDGLSALLKQLRIDVKESDGDKNNLDQQLKKCDEEKKELDRLWREQPIVLGSPFNLQIDWFQDAYSGGSRFKTWAGQQSVIDITRAMSKGVAHGRWDELEPEKWLDQPSDDESVPFSFDSNLGPQASSLDVGYSLDALKISSRTRPLIELGAFIGLQRFRPFPVDGENRYRYRVWHDPLTVRVASIATCTILSLPNSTDLDFRLLYRTKYLKSFLPANQSGASI